MLLESHSLSAPASRFPKMEDEVWRKFLHRRSKGRKVSHVWLSATAMASHKRHYPVSPLPFLASPSWRRRFCKRHKISRRRKTNVKHRSAEQQYCFWLDIRRLPKIQRWHARYRVMLSDVSKKRKTSGSHDVYGRFPLSSRFNVDEIPLPFINDQSVTYEVRYRCSFGSTSEQNEYGSLSLATVLGQSVKQLRSCALARIAKRISRKSRLFSVAKACGMSCIGVML